GKRYLAIAYPPMEQKNTDATVAVDARKSELNRYRQNGTGPLMLCVGLKSSRKLSKFTVFAEISRGGGRNVYLFSASLSLNAAHTSQINGASMIDPTSASRTTRP